MIVLDTFKYLYMSILPIFHFVSLEYSFFIYSFYLLFLEQHRSSSSPLDKRIKNKLICDAFHLVGFQPFDSKEEDRKNKESHTSRLHRGVGGAGRSSSRPTKSSSSLKRRNVLKLTK